MNLEDAIEWMKVADNDFDSAILLNEAVRRHYEIICYHCAQAAEKYLKGYLIYQNTITEKPHNLIFLNNLCIEIDGDFGNLKTACDFLNQFATNIRYPNKYEVIEKDVNSAISAVEIIRNFEPILNLRNIAEREQE